MIAIPAFCSEWVKPEEEGEGEEMGRGRRRSVVGGRGRRVGVGEGERKDVNLAVSMPAHCALFLPTLT